MTSLASAISRNCHQLRTQASSVYQMPLGSNDVTLVLQDKANEEHKKRLEQALEAAQQLLRRQDVLIHDQLTGVSQRILVSHSKLNVSDRYLTAGFDSYEKPCEAMAAQKPVLNRVASELAL